MKAFRTHKGLLTRKTIHGFTCLDLAIQNGQFNMIMFLCVYLKLDVNTAEHSQGNTPLHCAVINEDFVMVQFLVHEFRVKRSRLDLNKIRYDYHTAYDLAQSNPSPTSQKIVKYLISHGASTITHPSLRVVDIIDEPCIVDKDKPVVYEDM